MKKLRLSKTYTTLEDEKLDLSSLTRLEKRVLKNVIDLYNEGKNYLSFQEWIERNVIMRELWPEEKWVTPEIEKLAIYKVLMDLAKRLGIEQDYLRKCEVVKNCGHKHRHREIEITYIAKRLNCTRQFVLNALQTGKLRGRNDRGKHLIRIKDANAFIRHHKSKRRK